VDQEEKLEAKSGKNSGGFAQACAAARAASRTASECRSCGRIDILSGSNHPLNRQITLLRHMENPESSEFQNGVPFGSRPNILSYPKRKGLSGLTALLFYNKKYC
jgi:hypothetical protein